MTSCTGAGGTGTLYSYAQLEGLWIQAGGSKALAPVMAAIAMAESDGCSTALNPSGASGLWQILGAVNPADQGNLFDPAVNAKEATLKYSSQGLGAWVTYTSGAYKGYLSGSTTPDTNVPTLDASDTASAGGDCAITMPSIDLGVTSIGGTCLVTYSTERALIAGALMGVAGIMALAGLIILAAAGFQRSGALSTAADAAAVVPGAGRLARGLTAAHGRVSRTGGQA